MSDYLTAIATSSDKKSSAAKDFWRMTRARGWDDRTDLEEFFFVYFVLDVAKLCSALESRLFDSSRLYITLNLILLW